ncbi:Tripartite tricarboxylate transporter TctB family protein [compost metagenome]
MPLHANVFYDDFGATRGVETEVCHGYGREDFWDSSSGRHPFLDLRDTRMTNIILGLGAFLVAGLYTFGIFQIPLLGFGDPLGPRLFPSILAGSLLLIGVALLIEARSIQGKGADLSRLFAYFKSSDFRTITTVVGCTGLYFLTFAPLGYLVSTTILLFGLIFVFHRGSRLVGGSVALVFPTATYFLFAGLFGVPLPSGILPF